MSSFNGMMDVADAILDLMAVDVPDDELRARIVRLCTAIGGRALRSTIMDTLPKEYVAGVMALKDKCDTDEEFVRLAMNCGANFAKMPLEKMAKLEEKAFEQCLSDMISAPIPHKRVQKPEHTNMI